MKQFWLEDPSREPTEEIRALQKWYRDALRAAVQELNVEYARRWDVLKEKHKEYLAKHYGEM